MASNEDVLKAVDSLAESVSALAGQVQTRQGSSAQQVVQSLAGGAQIIGSSADDDGGVLTLFRLLIEEIHELNVQLRTANRMQGGSHASPESVMKAVRQAYKEEMADRQRTPIVVIQNR